MPTSPDGKIHFSDCQCEWCHQLRRELNYSNATLEVTLRPQDIVETSPEDYQVIERDPPTLKDIHDRAYHEARGCKYLDVTSMQDRKGTRRWIRKEPAKDLE